MAFFCHKSIKNMSDFSLGALWLLKGNHVSVHVTIISQYIYKECLPENVTQNDNIT